jgi:hypothetical protein
MRWWLAGGALFAPVLASALIAHASAPPIHVQVDATASCPSAAMLRDQLAPLLAAGTALTVDARSAVAGERAAVVRDLGAGYAVATAGAQRELDDGARSCLERARVASVFIALNLGEQARAPAPQPVTPEPQPAAEREQRAGRDGDEPSAEAIEIDEPAVYAVRRPLRGLGMELFGAAAYATEIDRAAPGAGAGAWWAPSEWRFGARVAVLAPAEIALDAASDPRGKVALVRIPLAASASYTLQLGHTFALLPTAGVQLDVLHVTGKNVAQPESALRLNPGALLALDAQLQLGTRVFALLRLGASAYPRAYHLSLTPTGRAGTTPRIWLGATLGMGWGL